MIIKRRTQIIECASCVLESQAYDYCMAIHYENYKAFSRGQGFVGSACRPQSAQATTARWFACDCRKCKDTLLGKRIISRDGVCGLVETVHSDRIIVKIPGVTTMIVVNLKELDADWAPIDLDEVFGMKSADFVSGTARY